MQVASRATGYDLTSAAVLDVFVGDRGVVGLAGLEKVFGAEFAALQEGGQVAEGGDVIEAVFGHPRQWGKGDRGWQA